MGSVKKLCGFPTLPRVTLLGLVIVAGAMIGCSEEPGGDRVENQPPTVWLSSAPPEGNDTKYRIRLFWGGWDPDGEISHYEFAITDNEGGAFDPADTVTTPDHNPWGRVYGSDSLFTFSADVLRDTLTTSLVSRFERSHTFFIRAVDEAGLASSEPAYRSFTAWTLSPTVTIKVPRRAGQSLTPAQVPSIATYRWVAEDFVNTNLESQEPDSVRWILHPVPSNDFPGGIKYVRDNPNSEEWSDWHNYRAPEDSGKSWTTPPTDLGTYVFAVQAKDEAGAVTPVFDEAFNVRRIRVSAKSTGPTLTVTNEFTGPIQTSVVNSPTVILDLPAGVPLQFTWSADAEGYGGLVSGYRYGWDIADLADPAQWEVDYTPFTTERAKSPTRTFFFGTHTFDVEVIDNSGARSRVEIKINVIQFTMNKSLLFVDDYDAKSTGIIQTNGAVPSDAEHDAFWQEMLDDVADFFWEDDAISVKAGSAVSIVKFADYKTVVWDALGGYNVSDLARPKLYDLIQYRPKTATGSAGGTAGKVQPNLLSLFQKAGGHLMLCGLQPMTQVLRSARVSYKYPFIFKYELGGDQDGNYADQIQSGNPVGDQSFAYQDACVNTLDLAYSGFGQIRDQFNNGCGAELIRKVDPRNEGMREARPIDTSFPLLELRDEVAVPGKAYSPTVKGWNTEIYNPSYFNFCNVAETANPRPCFQPIYGHGCLNTTSPIYGAPIAFWSRVYEEVVPEEGGGVPARSVIFGFEPYYFKPTQVKQMIDVILFDEWQLPQF
jgi:hypothetical protein